MRPQLSLGRGHIIGTYGLLALTVLIFLVFALLCRTPSHVGQHLLDPVQPVDPGHPRARRDDPDRDRPFDLPSAMAWAWPTSW